jgi:hypothetical protein
MGCPSRGAVCADACPDGFLAFAILDAIGDQCGFLAHDVSFRKFGAAQRGFVGDTGPDQKAGSSRRLQARKTALAVALMDHIRTETSPGFGFRRQGAQGRRPTDLVVASSDGDSRMH